MFYQNLSKEEIEGMIRSRQNKTAPTAGGIGSEKMSQPRKM